MKKKYWLLFLIVFGLQMCTAFYFCYQKQGFHEDEFYSYYSTCRTNGFFIEEDTWMEKDAYRNEFVVLEGAGFQYGLVKLVQSWDVHPPVYYWILHTVCSFFPGQFSKWFGLVPNLIFYGISLFLLWKLSLQLTKGNEKTAWLVCLFYGFTPAAMSSIVFIRMYVLLTVFVLLCAILHMRAIEDYEKPNDKLSVKAFLLPLAVVTYFGFLTQYYYFIFLFFMAAGFCLYLLWKDRNLWNSIRYGVSLAVSFVLAYLTYPSCLGQMFRGQRGAQATDNFFDFSNTLERLGFFWNLLDVYVFGRMFAILLLVIAVLFVTVRRKAGEKDRKKNTFGKSYGLLLFAVIGYFLVVSKTGLLLGETSVRYQTPIYGMVVLLVFEAIRLLGAKCFAADNSSVEEKSFTTGNSSAAKKCFTWKNWGVSAAAVLCFAVNLFGLLSDKVVFLYPEEAEHMAFAKEQAAKQTPVVYLYDTGQSWCVWDCADEFFAYDAVYFSDCRRDEAIADNRVAQSEELVVYVSNAVDTKEALRRVLQSNQNLSEYELRYHEKYCDVYFVH